MKRLFAIPFISALVGGGVVVAVLAASGSLSSSSKTVTEVQAAAPVSTSSTAASSTTIPTRSGGGGGLSAHEIYERTAPSVVKVTSTIVRQSESPFGFGESAQQGTATGSGFVIDSNGTLLTNWHVVENASKVTVSFEHSKTVEAHVVGKNPSQDLAVLKIPTEGLTLHPLTLGDSSAVEVGEPVVAIGNPFGLSRTLTTGVISALQREITAPNGFAIDNVLQTDAPINPGNSGGPLLNAKGQVIGITSQIETGGGGSDGNVGIGFAVPINTAKTELPELEKNGSVQTAYLGVGWFDRRLALQPQPARQKRRADRESRSRKPRRQGWHPRRKHRSEGRRQRNLSRRRHHRRDGRQKGDELRKSRLLRRSKEARRHRHARTVSRVGQWRLHQEERHRYAR